MKLLAFYAAALLMLCVMVFGGIEGFSFKLRMETGEFFSDTAGFNTEQFNPDLRQSSGQIKHDPAISELKRNSNLKYCLAEPNLQRFCSS